MSSGTFRQGFRIACLLVLSGRVSATFEEILDICIRISKLGMLACHKFNYMNYINLSPRYSNLIAINLTIVVC
jgi:hypothetical protein